MNVRALQEKPLVIDMGPVRSSRPTDKTPLRNSPPKGSQSKSIQPSNASRSNVSPPKGSRSNVSPPKGSRSNVSPPKGSQSKVSSPKVVANKNPHNSNVCFLCGKAGHVGNQSSCHAANKERRVYYN